MGQEDAKKALSTSLYYHMRWVRWADARDAAGITLLHVAAQNGNKRIA